MNVTYEFRKQRSGNKCILKVLITKTTKDKISGTPEIIPHLENDDSIE